MATYASWTQQEKDDMADMLTIVAPMMIDMIRGGNNGDAALARWNGGLSTLVTNLDAGEEIPNPTGLSGGGPVTKENLQNNIMSYVTTLAGLNTQGHIDNVTPLTGAQNLVFS